MKNLRQKKQTRRHNRTKMFHLIGVLGFLLLIISYFVFFNKPNIAKSQLATKPNIVLVVTDDQSYDALTAMSYLKSKPFGNWVEFTNAYFNTALCCPSGATMLTGQYSHHTGVEDNTKGNLFNEASALPTWLSAAGYETGLFGKYLNQYPFGRGNYIPQGWNSWAAFNHPPAYLDYDLIENSGLVHYTSTYSTSLLASKVVSFINNTASTKPFFVMYTPYAPHDPRTVEDKYKGTLKDLTMPRYPNYNEADVSDKPAWVKALPLLTSTQKTTYDTERRKQYRTLLSVDDAIKSIFTALENKGVLDNTVFIFSSDNGFTFGEHRYHGKKCGYQECIHNTLLIRYPSATGRTENRLVSNIDFAPTIAAIAGASPSASIDGVSLVPLINNTVTTWRDSLLIHFIGDNAVPPYWGVIKNDWKYVELGSGEKELYNLTNDPYELQNVVNQPAYSTTQQDLAQTLTTLKQ